MRRYLKPKAMPEPQKSRAFLYRANRPVVQPFMLVTKRQYAYRTTKA